MGKYYSDTLNEAIRLLYFQADPSKFPQGVKLAEQAVEAGEPDACYILSRCYAWEDGGVKEDLEKALKLLKRGIELGSDLCILGADRMNELKGEIAEAMTKTREEAFYAVLAQAQSGDPVAQYAVGVFYFWGDMLFGIQRPLMGSEEFARCERENALEALKWFRCSAEQGFLPAFCNAFNSVRKGLNSVPKNEREAYAWVETMKDKVDLRDYYYNVGCFYQEQKDYGNANRWFRMGMDAGDSSCVVSLGLVYLYGDRGLPMDEKEALRLFEVAAQMGDSYGYHNMGRCYYSAWGCTKDYRKAFECFDRAVQMGNPTSPMFLSRCYYWGRGVNEDKGKAFRLAKSQKEAGKSCPEEILGLCYLYGTGTAPDYALAKELLERNSKEFSAACIGMGDMYDKGLGVPEDVQMAVSYYQKAEKWSNPLAAERMSHFKKTLFGKWKRK